MPGLDRDYLAIALDAEGWGSSMFLDTSFPTCYWTGMLNRCRSGWTKASPNWSPLATCGEAGWALQIQHTWPSCSSTRCYPLRRFSPWRVNRRLSGRVARTALLRPGVALVHYLELADGGEQAWRLTTFVGLLSRGVPDGDAAAQAFGTPAR